MAKKENILNAPNLITFLRVILSFVIVYLFFTESDIIVIVVIFGIAASTDFLDGQIARMFNQETEFGRKFDMIADRILWGSTAIVFLLTFSYRGLLGDIEVLQLFLIMSRELITLPFAFVRAIEGKVIPEARKIGKLVTVLQGFALPILMLSIFYDFFNFAIYLSIITGIVGAISASYFIRDINPVEIKRNKKS